MATQGESCCGPSPDRCDTDCTCELVWEGANGASAVAPNGAVLRLGDDWSPAALLSLAAASDVMKTFFQLANARGLAPLGYVSSSHVANVGAGAPELFVSICVVVTHDHEVPVAENLCSEAGRESPIARSLGVRLQVEFSVAVIDTPQNSTPSQG